MGSSDVFQHLSEEEVQAYMKGFIAAGMDEDEAFTEVYLIDCNMEEDE